MVVDDDLPVANAVAAAGISLGLTTIVCESCFDFLEKFRSVKPHCIVLDVKMPGMTGIELLRSLQTEPYLPPVIMMSGHGDVPLAVEAMQLGAMTFLEKPFAYAELCEQISTAVPTGIERQQRAAERDDAIRLLQGLKPREHEMLKLILEGQSNKQMATALDLSLRGVEDRRARIMERLKVSSLAELCNLVHRARTP